MIESIEVSFFDNMEDEMSIPLPFLSEHYHQGNVKKNCTQCCNTLINNKD